MSRFSVWRCSKCGSEEAGPDEGGPRVESTSRRCPACGEAGDGEAGAGEVRDRDAGAPLRDSSFGCERCQGADAEVAWTSGRRRHLQSLVDESHYDIAITTCDCGQHFVKVFTERIDWVHGEDDQTWLLLPVHPAEVQQLQQCPIPELRAMVTRFGEGRRFVVHWYPTGGALSTAWRDGGFWIGPHD